MYYKNYRMNLHNSDSRIPVTILTGFLGSGKTTLLNRLIKDNPNKKFAIIENEFGEVGIDSELVVGVEEGIFEMSNGCVCCTLNDELITVLFKLIDRKEKIDHLIVETTGIADPAPVAMSFISDFKIKSIFRLDGIIALADAQYIEQQLENNEEACRQLAMADLVLVNKTDRVEPYLKETAINIIRKMNSQAQVKECEFGKVAGLDPLNIRAFSREDVLPLKSDKDKEFHALSDYLNTVKPTGVKSSPSLQIPSFAHKNISRHRDIASHSFIFHESLDLLRFDIWLRSILNHTKFDMYRVKGILNFRGLNEKIILQGVNNQYLTESGGLWGEMERLSKVVFIGKNLDKEILLHGLKVCCSDKPFDPEEFYNEIKY